MTHALRVAVLLPCLNEEAAIGKVVADFHTALPEAAIFVIDNASTDATAAVARAAGATVLRESLRGKGHALRRAFADIEADIYVMADGDDTYDSTAAPTLVAKLLDERLDMVTGQRVTDIIAAYRPGHRLGNRVLTGMVAWVFGNRVTDLLSGYRVFSRRFVKSFPALTAGFETETEFTVHALELHMPVGEMPVRYKDRLPGSTSKLHTYRDGLRVLRIILVLIKEERPLQFFALISLLLMLTSLGLGVPVIVGFLHTGLVPRLPTALLATGLMLLSFLSLASGLVLDSVARGRKEAKHLAYLAIPAPPSPNR